MLKTYLITGGAGFIGSNYIHYKYNKYSEINIICLDKLTYAGNLKNLEGLEKNLTYFYHPEDEGCIAWNDKAIGIEWPLKGIDKIIISDKDRNCKSIDEILS